MSNKKISALTSATTPLAGTEVLPIVQSSATVKVSVANLTAGRDITINTATAGLGPGAVSTNTAFGYQVINGTTTAAYQTAFGYQALYSNGSNNNNTAFGYKAGYGVIGANSTMIGANTGATASGANSTAVGYNALTAENAFSGGGSNTAVGATALAGVVGGNNNVAIGSASGSAITSGSQNVILGSYTGSASPISATGSNYIVFSDGGGNVRGYYNSTGNLVVPVAAKGVDFTANTPAAGKTSQLLNWYEEGTWTPTAYGSTTVGTTTYTNQTGYYTRIGRQVFCYVSVEWSAQTGTGSLRIGGLPFTISNSFPDGFFTAFNGYADLTHASAAKPISNTTYVLCYQYNAGGAGNFFAQFSYFV